jgi:hypothetical protein
LMYERISSELERLSTRDALGDQEDVVKIYVDTTGKQVTVSRDPEPKVDQNGRQRVEKESGRPLNQTQVMVMDESGGEVLMVTTAGEKPNVRQGQLVQLVQLEAIPWSMETNGKARSGVSFRAVEIKPIEVRSGK